MLVGPMVVRNMLNGDAGFSRSADLNQREADLIDLPTPPTKKAHVKVVRLIQVKALVSELDQRILESPGLANQGLFFC